MPQLHLVFDECTKFQLKSLHTHSTPSLTECYMPDMGWRNAISWEINKTTFINFGFNSSLLAGLSVAAFNGEGENLIFLCLTRMFVLSANAANVSCRVFETLLIYKLKSYGPKLLPWGMPAETA